MRSMRMTASSLLVAAPLLSFGIGSPVRADPNDVMGQAQRFMNNRGDDRDSYDRRRDDERRGQQALRERDGDRRDYDRDRSRDDRYRQPDSGYGRR
jgi:hypothetical protein